MTRDDWRQSLEAVSGWADLNGILLPLADWLEEQADESADWMKSRNLWDKTIFKLAEVGETGHWWTVQAYGATADEVPVDFQIVFADGKHLWCGTLTPRTSFDPGRNLWPLPAGVEFRFGYAHRFARIRLRWQRSPGNGPFKTADIAVGWQATVDRAMQTLAMAKEV